MGHLAVIAAVAAVTYATRVTGFYLGRQTFPRMLDRFLDYVPVAAFAALIVPGVDSGGDALLPRLIGLTVAAYVGFRIRQLWAVIVAGMAVFWIVGTMM